MGQNLGQAPTQILTSTMIGAGGQNRTPELMVWGFRLSMTPLRSDLGADLVITGAVGEVLSQL